MLSYRSQLQPRNQEKALRATNAYLRMSERYFQHNCSIAKWARPCSWFKLCFICITCKNNEHYIVHWYKYSIQNGFEKSHSAYMNSAPIISLHIIESWVSAITKTCLFKYTEHFNHQKWKNSDKSSNISHTSGQNIDCGYSLEPPRWGGSNEYPQSMFLGRNKKNNVYPCNPSFTI